MIEDALSNRARWKATVLYRTEAGPLDVKMLLDELCDLHDRVEQGPHWDTIASIVVERMNRHERSDLTIERAAKLSLSGHLGRGDERPVAFAAGNDRGGVVNAAIALPFNELKRRCEKPTAT